MPQSLTRTVFAAAILAASIAIHLGLLGAIVMAERRRLAKPEVETIAVELLKPEVFQEELKKQEEKKEETKKNPAKFELPKPDQQRPDIPKQQQQQSAPQQPQPRPEPRASQKSAKAQPQELPPPGEASPPEQDEKPNMPSGGAPSETKAKLTPDEIAAFRAEIQRCWEIPVGLPEAMKLEVVLRVGLSRKGALIAPPELLKAPASVHGPALAGIAMKAMSSCGPYKSLPAAKYNEWKVLDLRFLATGMAGLDTTRIDTSKLPRG